MVTLDTSGFSDMDLVEDSDVEDELEDFNRLRRMGNFKEAIHHFDVQLKARLDTDPSILVQYAEMLLEQGDYRSLNELEEKHLFDSPEDESPEPIKRLHLYWSLIRIIALQHSHSIQPNLNIDVIEQAISTVQPERDALEVGPSYLLQLTGCGILLSCQYPDDANQHLCK